MATFAYIAVDSAGNRCQGELQAAGRDEAMADIVRKGLLPVTVEAANGAGGPSAKFISKGKGKNSAERPIVKKMGRQVSEDFCRELGSLLAAGISMSRALAILASQSSRNGREVIQGINIDVVGGMSLAEAMSRRPGAFTRVQVAMVRAGETGGFLDVVLQQIADFQAAQRDLTGRIQSAMAYPMILAFVAVSVMVFLLTYFIPKFTTMFAGLGGTLPALTRAVIAVSNVLVDHGPVALGLAIVSYIVARKILQSDAAGYRFQAALLATPMLGEIISHLALVRFCQMLSALIAAGVPLVASLRVAQEALGNRILTETTGQAIEDVVAGKSLSNSLRGAGRLFPPSAIEMIAVAEEAGRLDKELQRLAEVYQSRLDRRLRMMVALAEPVMLFIMAALVAVIVIGMLLPIFNLQDLIH